MISVEEVKTKVFDLCPLFQVKRLGVFGSLVRGQLRDDSDIDFVVEFNDDGYSGRFDRYMGLMEALEKQFCRKIDLITYESMRNPVFKSVVEREAKIIYG